MRIQHNIPAMSAYRNYTNNTSALAKNLEKLSSGYKINRAGDDAAGLAISEKMRAQITGLEVAQKNAKDGISLVQTAEGALTEVHDMLNRMYELAEQSANGTYQDEVDREQLQKEIVSLRTEIDRIAESTNFNGIKLLDGSLGSSEDMLVGEMASTSVNFSDGITASTTAAGGSKGEYSIDITQQFGAGDKMTVNFQMGAGTTGSTPTALSSGIIIAYSTAASYDSANNTVYFTGKTADEQAQSIAEQLSAIDDISAAFDVTAEEGGTVKLTNKNEGNAELTVNSVTIDANNTVAKLNSTDAAAAGCTGGTGEATTAGAGTIGPGAIAFTDMFDRANGMEFEDGDVLTFELTDANGHKWVTEVTVEAGASDDATATNILNALNNDAVFKDIDGTVADESKIKFSDFFTASAATSATNTTTAVDLSFKSEAGAEIFVGGSAKVSSSNSNVTYAGTGTVNTTAASFGAGRAQEYDLVLDTGSGQDGDYSIGDKLKFEGTLSDGRTFDFELEAGVDFDIGESHDATNANIIKALQETGKKITLDDGAEVNTNQIFGNKKEIEATAVTGAGIKFESQMKTDTHSGNITQITLSKTADLPAVTPNLVNGNQQTAASASLTFEDDKIKHGAVIDVNGQKYEIVADAADVTDGNKAIVIDEADLADGAKVADAVKTHIEAEMAAAGDTSLKIEKKGNTVIFKDTTAVGATSVMPSVDAVGGQQKALEFTLDPKKVRAGSTVTINGTTYEFVKNAGDLSKDEYGNAKNVAVVVDNLGSKSLTSKDLADKLVEAAANHDKVTVEADANGKVTVKGKPEGEGFVDPEVTLSRKGGLMLQIGDTAESFNQLTVGINDCHARAIKYTAPKDATGYIQEADGMTLADIDVSTQEGAAKAMAVIKDAVNYISDVRGDLGATQNRLDHTINNLGVMQENIQDAESTIRDVDVAKEMMEYTKNNILVQSAQAMLAQANQLPQGVLQLLQ